MAPGMEPIDRSRLETVSAQQRGSKVGTPDFAVPVEPSKGMAEFFDSLPKILRAADLRALAATTAKAHADGRGVCWGLGGHVIKVGLAPLLIDLMERGLVTSLLMNGSAAIHDYEIALMGRTSEDVGPGVQDGTFGMADETGTFFAEALANHPGAGFGEAVMAELEGRDLPHREYSLLDAARRHGVPVTVHVALGTDIVHMHPACDGAQIGAASHRDFLLFAAICERLDRGVYLNWGSAVIAPEVFVKAVTMQNNLRETPLSITTANFDQLRHYRPRVNVVERPAARGYDFAGHHEIMMPLFRLALLSELEALQ
jgi:hypothetical protein